ncbi:hypothetical protein BDD12DRAFT_940902 [Trichophaea hybrida]|nr:hypothetical protein BDD12DRAFT_940902 [Trichophaea hybrida]
MTKTTISTTISTAMTTGWAPRRSHHSGHDNLTTASTMTAAMMAAMIIHHTAVVKVTMPHQNHVPKGFSRQLPMPNLMRSMQAVVKGDQGAGIFDPRLVKGQEILEGTMVLLCWIGIKSKSISSMHGKNGNQFLNLSLIVVID